MRFGMEHTDLTALTVEHNGGGIPFFEPIAAKFKSGEYRHELPTEIIP
jgi:aspartyl-tRNA synthetase